MSIIICYKENYVFVKSQLVYIEMVVRCTTTRQPICNCVTYKLRMAPVRQPLGLQDRHQLRQVKRGLFRFAAVKQPGSMCMNGVEPAAVGGG